MNLVLNLLEKSILGLHMKIIRKNIKKGFKKNYGSKQGKELINQYDLILSRLEIEKEEETILSLDLDQDNLLKSFLNWYITQLQDTFEKTGVKIIGEDQEHLNILKVIQNKLNKVCLAYA